MRGPIGSLYFMLAYLCIRFHLPTDFMDIPVVYWNTVQWVQDYNVEFVSMDNQVNVGTRVALDSVSNTEFGVVKALGVMSSGKIWCVYLHFVSTACWLTFKL